MDDKLPRPRHFVSPPYGRSLFSPGCATFDVYREVEWARDMELPPMGVVAACTTREAAEAAVRLLCAPEVRDGS